MGVFNVELKKVVDDSYEIEIGFQLEDKLLQDIKQGLVQRGCNAAAVESHACINGGFTGPLISCTLSVRRSITIPGNLPVNDTAQPGSFCHIAPNSFPEFFQRWWCVFACYGCMEDIRRIQRQHFLCICFRCRTNNDMLQY